jgi:murein L,D-transpeptidase YcbB/YkuD
MKTHFVLLMAICLFGTSICAQTLSKAERKAAVKYINWTTKELKKSLKGLSEAQLNFKAAPDKWSAQDCMYHLAFAEGALRGALDQAIKSTPDPAARAELKMTDEMIKNSIVDRSNKVKTPEPFEPQKTGFKSLAEAVAAFDSKRAMLVELVKTTTGDLRNQIVTLPFGKMDAYQFILFIAGHTNRHTLQIEEAKAASGYPQS